MPRFFFHLRHSDGVVKDEEGLALANVSLARLEALESIADRIRQCAFATKPLPAEDMIVMDEYGNEIAVFPVFPRVRSEGLD